MEARMGSPLKEKISRIRELLLDPFRVEGLEKEIVELYEMMKKASPREVASVKKDYEEIRDLLGRNLSIISDSLKPVVKRGRGGLFSRRV
jgi:hypothetical protein